MNWLGYLCFNLGKKINFTLVLLILVCFCFTSISNLKVNGQTNPGFPANSVNSSAIANPSTSSSSNLKDPRLDPYTKMVKNGYDGKSSTNLNLGRAIRDDDPKAVEEYAKANSANSNIQQSFKNGTLSCMQMGGNIGGPNTVVGKDKLVHPSRRVGICEDGIYTLSQRMIDTSGNVGDWSVGQQIERDTVSPVAPTVEIGKNGDILGEFLSIKISGEVDSTANIEVFTESSYEANSSILNLKLNGDGLFVSTNLIGKLRCGKIKYFTKVKVTDRAGNTSESSQSNTIETQECPVCGSNGNGQFLFPIQTTKVVITGEFPRYAIDSGAPHAGKDFAAPFDTPIVAVEEGIVKRAVFSFIDNYGKSEPINAPGGWANVVIIEHAGGLQTVYAHLAPNNAGNIYPGQKVARGQLIGLMGSTGSSGGSHLHFQVEKEGAPLNPIHIGMYNRWPPVNPTPYFGEIKTNLPKNLEDIYCAKTSQSGGDSLDDWLYKKTKAEDLGEVKLYFTKDFLGFVHFTKSDIPAPRLTRVVRDENDKNLYRVYGVGVRKNQKAKAYVYNMWNGKTEEKDIEIQHSQWLARPIDFANTEWPLTDGWNDEENGRFNFWIRTDGLFFSYKAGLDQPIVARTKIYGDFSCGAWNNCDYRQDFNLSSRSNAVRLNEFEFPPNADLENDFKVLSNGDFIMANLRVHHAPDYANDRLKYNSSQQKNVWIISHGMNNSRNDMSELANSLTTQRGDDIILTLDWAGGAATSLPNPNNTDQWIRPTAKQVANKLRDWGFSDPSKLHVIGHSMGSIMSSEISRQFSYQAKTLIALDPPKAPSGSFIVDDDPSEPDRVFNSFSGKSQFSRSFVGKGSVSGSVCGNYSFNETTNESYIFQFPDILDPTLLLDPISFNPCPVHGEVIRSFAKLIGERQLEADLLGINDTNSNRFSRLPYFNNSSVNGYLYAPGNVKSSSIQFLEFNNDSRYGSTQWGTKAGNTFKNYDWWTNNTMQRKTLKVENFSASDNISIDYLNNSNLQNNYKVTQDYKILGGQKVLVSYISRQVKYAGYDPNWYIDVELYGNNALNVNQDQLQNPNSPIFVKRR